MAVRAAPFDTAQVASGLTKQLFQRGPGRILTAAVARAFQPCSGFEVITEIGPLLVAYFFNRRFAALLIGATLVQGALATAMQIVAAGFATVHAAQGQGERRQ